LAVFSQQPAVFSWQSAVPGFARASTKNYENQRFSIFRDPQSTVGWSQLKVGIFKHATGDAAIKVFFMIDLEAGNSVPEANC